MGTNPTVKKRERARKERQEEKALKKKERKAQKDAPGGGASTDGEGREMSLDPSADDSQRASASAAGD